MPWIARPSAQRQGSRYRSNLGEEWGCGAGLLDGALLGLAIWTIGYLGWLPASGLLPPVQEQAAEQVAAPIAQHLVFGIATVAAYQALRRTI